MGCKGGLEPYLRCSESLVEKRWKVANLKGVLSTSPVMNDIGWGMVGEDSPVGYRFEPAPTRA
jgi:hypothetical protein